MKTGVRVLRHKQVILALDDSDRTRRTLILAALLRCRSVAESAAILGVDVGRFLAWQRAYRIPEPPRTAT